jgi:hypothetical protein
MTEFDPAQPALVHDRVNDQMMEWSPDWRDNYRKYARPDAPGVVAFDGLLLDGWRPLLKVVSGSPMTETDADAADDRTSIIDAGVGLLRYSLQVTRKPTQVDAEYLKLDFDPEGSKAGLASLVSYVKGMGLDLPALEEIVEGIGPQGDVTAEAWNVLKMDERGLADWAHLDEAGSNVCLAVWSVALETTARTPQDARAQLALLRFGSGIPVDARPACRARLIHAIDLILREGDGG